MSNELTHDDIFQDLLRLGVQEGDGLFVHASLSAIGKVSGGADTIIDALVAATGEDGLIAMPGFSSDAYMPSDFNFDSASSIDIKETEEQVPGHDPLTSPASGMGIIAETFRTRPGTLRSSHPCVSVCISGRDATLYASEHKLEWATGPGTPLVALASRKNMKLLLLAVGWNRCSALHSAETIAVHRRTKIRRFKVVDPQPMWIETPDVADDLDRLFPLVGKDFELTGAVDTGLIGGATSKICGYQKLLDFASNWIDQKNKEDGVPAIS